MYSYHTKNLICTIVKINFFFFYFCIGKGLGKKENGITQAIKPKLKFDTSGIGHKDTDFEWWSSVYNKAASNIVLDNKSDSVSIDVADKNAVNITSKEEATLDKNSFYHGQFLKSSTLQDGKLIKDINCLSLDEEKKIDSNSFIKMSDEELFKACGGRTAHKGARHGLTLNGKLARIAQQELSWSSSQAIEFHKKIKQSQEKTRLKETRSLDGEENNDDLILPVAPVYIGKDQKPSKKSVKKSKRKIQDLVQQLNKTCLIAKTGVEEITGEDTSEDNSQRINKKKKKSKRKREQMREFNNDSDTSAACLLDDDVNMVPSSKKKKKNLTTCCDPTDPMHMCEKCDEFYLHHKEQYENYQIKFKSLGNGKKDHKNKTKANCKKMKNMWGKKGNTYSTDTNFNKETLLLKKDSKIKKKDSKIKKKEKKKLLKNLIHASKLKIPTSDDEMFNFNKYI